MKAKAAASNEAENFPTFEFVRVGWRGTKRGRRGRLWSDAAHHRTDEPVYALRLR